MIKRTGYTKNNDSTPTLVFLLISLGLPAACLFADKWVPEHPPTFASDKGTLQQLATWYAEAEGISAEMFHRQLQQESGWNPKAVSSEGAIGVAQIVPKWHPTVDPRDPHASIAYAAKWDAENIRQYGNCQQAMSVYNSGRPNAYKNPRFANGQTYNYVRYICEDKPL
jgi:soluble lytic murein transglycosylase-like protein